MSSGVTRSKDGVPQWSGDSSQFQEYEELCLQWEQSIQYQKRYLAGPKLVAELSGTARKFVVGKRPNWVSFNGGVEHLMNHLRQHLGRPQIPELSEYLNKYFRYSRRQKYESMNSYIVRKTEVYARARQALARVMDSFEAKKHGDWWRSSRTWWCGSWHGSSRRSQASWWEEDASAWHDARDEQDETGEAQASTEEAAPTSDWGTARPYDDDEDEDWTNSFTELLPDFLQGWYLLADAGLTSYEKNLIQTAVAGDFSLMRIAQELRSQWTEEDLHKRDQNQKQSGFWQDEVSDGDAEETPLTSASALISEGMSEEGLALVTEAEVEAEQAMALIQQGKRTLKEARAKQHQIKMSRQYYKVKDTTAKSSFGGSSTMKKQGISCFRCGGNHKVADCPDRQAPRGGDSANKTEEAPFVCYSESHAGEESFQALTCLEEDQQVKMTTAEAVDAGYGIIDGGATRTLGSTYALEAIANENYKKRQHGGVLEVDTTNTPKFGFGNSSTDRCVSTAKMRILADSKPGVLQVHALDKGKGPVLLSIATLRALKAIIDFDSDLIVFRALDDMKMIQATQSQAGHQLLPLTEDLYSNAVTCTKRVPSLREFSSSS